MTYQQLMEEDETAISFLMQDALNINCVDHYMYLYVMIIAFLYYNLFTESIQPPLQGTGVSLPLAASAPGGEGLLLSPLFCWSPASGTQGQAVGEE